MIRVHLSQNPIKFECLWFLWFFVKTSWQQPQNETENRKLSTFNFQLSTRENTHEQLLRRSTATKTMVTTTSKPSRLP
jgi:hypothetical protein